MNNSALLTRFFPFSFSPLSHFSFLYPYLLILFPHPLPFLIKNSNYLEPLLSLSPLLSLGPSCPYYPFFIHRPILPVLALTHTPSYFFSHYYLLLFLRLEGTRRGRGKGVWDLASW